MKFQKLLAIVLMVGFVLSVVTPARAVSLSWDPGKTPDTPSGGTGIWNETSDFWANSGTDFRWVNANLDDAVFEGAAGIVTLGEDISAGNIIFDTSGYTLDIVGHTLRVDGDLGAGGTLAMNNGVLKTTAPSAVDCNIALGASGGTFDATADTVLGGGLSGLTAITKTGAGTLDISGVGPLTNALNVDTGVLTTVGYQLVVGDLVTIANGAILNASGSVVRDISRNNTGAGLPTIRATGDLFIGDLGEFTSGVDFDGMVDTGGHTVVLLDSDTANITQAWMTNGARLTSTDKIAIPAGMGILAAGVFVDGNVELGGEVIFGDAYGGATQMWGLGPAYTNKVTMTQNRRGNVVRINVDFEVLGLNLPGFSSAADLQKGGTFSIGKGATQQIELHGNAAFGPDNDDKIIMAHSATNGQFHTFFAGDSQDYGTTLGMPGRIEFDAAAAKFEIVLGDGQGAFDYDDDYQPVNGDKFRIVETGVWSIFPGDFGNNGTSTNGDGEFIVLNPRTTGTISGGLNESNFIFPTLTDTDLSWAYEVVTGSGGYVEISVTPEPCTMALLAMGGVGMLMRRRRQRRPVVSIARQNRLDNLGAAEVS